MVSPMGKEDRQFQQGWISIENWILDRLSLNDTYHESCIDISNCEIGHVAVPHILNVYVDVDAYVYALLMEEIGGHGAMASERQDTEGFPRQHAEGFKPWTC